MPSQTLQQAQETLGQAKLALESALPEDCLQKVTSLIDDPETHPTISILALQLAGEAFSDLGDPQSAYDAYSKASELDSKGELGVEKFLWLGQVIGGAKGIEFYEKGLQGLDGSDESKRPLQIQALLGMIEIWMTDLCMEPEAEQACESRIAQALLVDDSVAECWSVLGSIRISQVRTDEAKEALAKAYLLYKAQPELSVDEVPALLRLAKSLVEVELLSEAKRVSERIISIDDRVADAYYICGLVDNELYVRDNSRQGRAVSSRRALNRVLQLHETASEDEHVDEELVEASKELLASVPEFDVEEEEDEDDDEDEYEEWEGFSDEE